MKIWRVHYSLGANGRNTYVKNYDTWDVAYGFYGPEPRNVRVENMRARDVSVEAIMAYLRPQGLITFDGVYLQDCSQYPFRITGKKKRPEACEVHIRNYQLVNIENNYTGATSEGYNSTSSPELTLYLHDFFGPGQDAKVIPINQNRNDGLTYQQMTPTFSKYVKVAHTDVPFPQSPIQPVDQLPPGTVILYPYHNQYFPEYKNQIEVRGICMDNSGIAKVEVNGQPAQPESGTDLTHWKILLQGLPHGKIEIVATATDSAGNQELNPHRITIWNGVQPTGIREETPIAQGFRLLGNWPNPFNPSTSIRIDVSPTFNQSGTLSLEIFNIKGQPIYHASFPLHNSIQYKIPWNGISQRGEKVPSGIYPYRVTIQSRNRKVVWSASAKMILLR